MSKNYKHILDCAEMLIEELGYTIRYEKGNFITGACVLKGTKTIVINKMLTPEGKSIYLMDIIRKIENLETQLNPKSLLLWHQLSNG